MGITAIEILTGHPPHSEIHPTNALFLIVQKDSPTLGNQFSKPLRDFVAACLQKNPEDRPSAKDLLKHKIFRNLKKSNLLLQLVRTHQDWLRQKADLASDSDSSEDRFLTYVAILAYLTIVGFASL